jgi:hypothetical protein
VFENRVLRRLFGPKRNEMTECRRKLHNKGAHSLYSSSDIIRMIKLRKIRRAEHVARVRGEKECIQYIGRWVNNIKMGLREIV